MKRKKRSFLKFLLLVALFSVPLLAWLFFSKHGLLHLHRLELEKQEVIQRINRLSIENQALMDEIKRLRTDPEYIESVAREELGLVKKNDLIFRFTDEPLPTADNKYKTPPK